MSVLNRLVKACCLYKAALGYGCLGLAIIGGFSSALPLTQCFPFQWIPEFTPECSPEWAGNCNLFLYLLCIIVYFSIITPPPIPTGLRESSRIPTGFPLDFNKFSKKAFSHIFSFLFLLDSHWTPMGLQLNLYKVNAMDSYWIPTGPLLGS